MAHPGGRPTVITDEVIRKLEEVFALGGTDLEACLYAGISKSAFYDYQQENPKFLERKEALKETPILRARTTIINSLENPIHAQWYLERKKRNEFSTRTETEHSGAINIQLTSELANKYDVTTNTEPINNSEGQSQVQSS